MSVAARRLESHFHAPRSTNMRTHPSRIALAAAIVLATIAPAGIAALRVEPDALALAASAPQANPARDAMIARINALLEQTWTDAKVDPASPASDGEFLR